jgi:hypothetical protein
MGHSEDGQIGENGDDLPGLLSARQEIPANDANQQEIHPLRVSRVARNPSREEIAGKTVVIQSLPSIPSDEEDSSSNGPDAHSTPPWAQDPALGQSLEAQEGADPRQVFGTVRRVTVFPYAGQNDTFPELSPSPRNSPATVPATTVVSTNAKSLHHSQPNTDKTLGQPGRGVRFRGGQKEKPKKPTKTQLLGKPPRRGLRRPLPSSVPSCRPISLSTKEKIEKSYHPFEDIALETGRVDEGPFNPYRVNDRFPAAILKPQTCAQVVKRGAEIWNDIPFTLDDRKQEAALGSHDNGFTGILTSTAHESTLRDVASILMRKLKRNEDEQFLLQFSLFCALRVDQYMTKDSLQVRSPRVCNLIPHFDETTRLVKPNSSSVLATTERKIMSTYA